MITFRKALTKQELFNALDLLYKSKDQLSTFLFYYNILNKQTPLISKKEIDKLNNLINEIDTTWNHFYNNL